jgi:hypothetical protein
MSLSLCLAQTKENTKGDTLEDVRIDILEKQAQLQEEIGILVTARHQEKESFIRAQPTSLEKKLEMLQQIDLIYEQQLLQVKRTQHTKRILQNTVS